MIDHAMAPWRTRALALVAMRWPVYLAVGATLIIWWGVDVQRRGRVDPRDHLAHRTDFTAFTEAGAAFFDGRDAYEVVNPRGWGYAYPPLFGLLVAPLHALDPQWQVSIWFFLCVAVAWGCCREGARILKACLAFSADDPPTTAIGQWIPWAALAVAVLPALNSLQRGQVDLLKLYLVLLGFRLTLTGKNWRPWLCGGLAFAGAVVLKLTPLLPVGLLGLMLLVRMLRNPRENGNIARVTALGTGLAIGAVAFVIFVPAALIGWRQNLMYLDQYQHSVQTRVNNYEDADRTGNTRTVRNQSFSNAVVRLGSFIGYEFLKGPSDRRLDHRRPEQRVTIMNAPGVDVVLLYARLGFVLLLVAAAVRSAWRGDALGQAACFALACAAALVVSPIARGSYFAELAPAVLVLPLWLARQRLVPAARFMAWVPAVLVALHYLAMPVTGRLGVLGLGTTVWCATGLVLLAIGARAPAPIEPPIPVPKGRRPIYRPGGSRPPELVHG